MFQIFKNGEAYSIEHANAFGLEDGYISMIFSATLSSMELDTNRAWRWDGDQEPLEFPPNSNRRIF